MTAASTNPHRIGTKAAARWEARQTRLRAKAAAAEKLAAEKLAAEKLAAEKLAALPQDIGNWGVTRTRAWARMSQVLRQHLAAKRPKVAVLEVDVADMRAIVAGTLSMENCARIAEGQRS